jgi:hypothetical protein
MQFGDRHRRAGQRAPAPPVVAQHDRARLADHRLFDDIGRSCSVFSASTTGRSCKSLQTGIGLEGVERLALTAEGSDTFRTIGDLHERSSLVR